MVVERCLHARAVVPRRLGLRVGEAGVAREDEVLALLVELATQLQLARRLFRFAYVRVRLQLYVLF